MSDQGKPLPKFGEWDVNDPASADGFTVIFNKARDEKKTGGKPESLEKADTHGKPGADPNKPQSVKKMALLRSSPAGGILKNSCRYKSFHCMMKPPPYILNKIGMNGGHLIKLFWDWI
ncbi:protein NOI4 isoform X1 [Gossypium hirsutum]|uniref:Protein NOI4 isoform X1 n=1 Tax=Gossypium hirsutum TaxID=3635 RepID=A0ABM3B0X6_GOSHI|nr:protein NOI4-like isoform X1 [Gossypium hirsutum]